jgi:hypothetical protein
MRPNKVTNRDFADMKNFASCSGNSAKFSEIEALVHFVSSFVMQPKSVWIFDPPLSLSLKDHHRPGLGRPRRKVRDQVGRASIRDRGKIGEANGGLNLKESSDGNSRGILLRLKSVAVIGVSMESASQS